jgi:nitroreductase
MATYTDLMDVIKGRRTIGKVKEDSVPQEMIEKVLEAGIWAPSHYVTEPWKFFVLQGDARNRLGDVLADIYKENLEKEQLSKDEQNKSDLQKKKPLRAPVIIAVAALPSDKPKVMKREELAAAACAVQNMLLAAHTLGLGAIWRTGERAYHPFIKKFLQLGENDEMLGFIYLGFPDMPNPKAKRIDADQKTVWMQ